MRVVLQMEGAAGDAVATALLQDGHAVHRFAPPMGPLALLAGWQSRRAAHDFDGDLLLGGGPEATRAARQLGLRHVQIGPQVWFLLARGIPVPFCADARRDPVLGVLGTVSGLGWPHVTLTGDAWQASLVDVTVLAGDRDVSAGAILADWMAAGRAIIGPKAVLSAEGLDAREALGFDGADPAGCVRAVDALMMDAGRRMSLSTAARQGFERRHAAVRAALRASL